jgi:hypothetical protein
LLLLGGIWIDSVTVSNCQPSSIILDLLADSTILNVKREGSIPSLLTASHPATKLSGVLAALDIPPSSYSGGLPGESDKRGYRGGLAMSQVQVRTFERWKV